MLLFEVLCNNHANPEFKVGESGGKGDYSYS